MAKQRNSLGICVLPLPGNTAISWERYKELTGIDLERIFEVVDLNNDPDNPSYMVQFKTSFSKIIVLSYHNYSTLEVPSVSIPSSIGNTTNADKALAYVSMTVYYGDFDGGYQLLIYANKTILGGDI